MNTKPAKPAILMIDDEERILRSLGILFKQSHQIFKTSDPKEFFEILDREYIHVIISDQRMPRVKGTDLLREAKVRSPHSMRILLTGYADIDAVMDSINEGEIYRYLTKPWDPNELKRTITKATDIAIKIQRSQQQDFDTEQDSHATIPDSFSLDDLENAVEREIQTNELINALADIEAPEPELTSNKAPVSDESLREPTKIHSKPPPQVVEQNSPRTPPKSDNTKDSDSAKEKILIINDSTAMYDNVKKLFAGKYNVLFANHLDSAVALLEQGDIAVSISDTKLSGIDIAPIIKALKQASPELVSIVITSFQDTGMLIDLINEGQIYRCLPKPVSANMLDKSVRHAMNHHLALKADATLRLRHFTETVEEVTVKEGEEQSGSSNISGFINRLRSKLGD